MSELEIKVIDQDFSICKPENLSQIKFEDDYIFIGKTDEELSLVCSTESVPDNTPVSYTHLWFCGVLLYV